MSRSWIIAGIQVDRWWYALLEDVDEAQRRDGKEMTLAMLEEQADSGRFFGRVPFERSLAERKNENAFWMFRAEFLC